MRRDVEPAFPLPTLDLDKACTVSLHPSSIDWPWPDTATAMNSTASTSVNSFSPSDDDAAKPAVKVVAKRALPADSRKQRGRPRVEPEDQTPQDRRRTQIRLAQRTYRARKESTIARLDNKVSRLQDAVQNTNTSVQSLYQLAVDTGIATASPFFFQELMKAANQASALTIESDRDSQSPEHCVDLGRNSKTEKQERINGIYQRLTPPASEEDSQSGHFHQAHDSERRLGEYADRSATSPENITSVWGYEVTHEPSEPSSPTYVAPEQQQLSAPMLMGSRPVCAPTPYTPPEQQQLLAPSQMGPRPVYGPAAPYTPPYQHQPFMGSVVPGPSAYGYLSSGPELGLPTSLAFNEASFSRWLHRAMLEHALILITRPNAGQNLDTSAFFSHALMHSTPPQIASRIKQRLARHAEESLDNPASYVEQMEDVANSSAWLGPDGIERYLASKGFTINVLGGTAICETASAPDPPAKPVSNAGWRAPDSRARNFNGAAYHGAAPYDPLSSYPVPQGRQAPNSNYGDMYGSSARFEPQNSLYRKRKRIIVDLSKLVNNMVTASACCGKTPAVPRNRINGAVNGAVICVEPV